METGQIKTKVSLSYEADDGLFLWYTLDSGEGKSVKVTDNGITIMPNAPSKSKSYSIITIGEDEVDTFVALLNAIVTYSREKEWFIETYITPSNKVDNESEQSS